MSAGSVMNESKQAMLELADRLQKAINRAGHEWAYRDLLLEAVAALRASAPQEDGRALENADAYLSDLGISEDAPIRSKLHAALATINRLSTPPVTEAQTMLEEVLRYAVDNAALSEDDDKLAWEAHAQKIRGVLALLREAAALSAPPSVALEDMPETLGDVIPVSEMVDRLERRGAELNAHAITPNGQLMLKAAFYLKALTRPQPGGAVAGTERGGIDG